MAPALVIQLLYLLTGGYLRGLTTSMLSFWVPFATFMMAVIYFGVGLSVIPNDNWFFMFYLLETAAGHAAIYYLMLK